MPQSSAKAKYLALFGDFAGLQLGELGVEYYLDYNKLISNLEID